MTFIYGWPSSRPLKDAAKNDKMDYVQSVFLFCKMAHLISVLFCSCLVLLLPYILSFQ